MCPPDFLCLQIFSCLMTFFLCNMMETHFLSTGAFEVTLNGESLSHSESLRVIESLNHSESLGCQPISKKHLRSRPQCGEVMEAGGVKDHQSKVSGVRLKVTSCCVVSPPAPDVPLWSKLQSGSVPNLQQIFQVLEQQLKVQQVEMNQQMDPSSFST